MIYLKVNKFSNIIPLLLYAAQYLHRQPKISSSSLLGDGFNVIFSILCYVCCTTNDANLK